MSLDVSLIINTPIKKGVASSGIFVRENGCNVEITREQWDERNPGIEPVVVMNESLDTFEAFTRNITHNLTEMADAAGIYKALWRPEEVDIYKAKDLIDPLREGLHKLKLDPDRFKKFNPPNKWGNYDGLVQFVESYLNACYEHPEAKVEVCR